MISERGRSGVEPKNEHDRATHMQPPRDLPGFEQGRSSACRGGRDDVYLNGSGRIRSLYRVSVCRVLNLHLITIDRCA